MNQSMTINGQRTMVIGMDGDGEWHSIGRHGGDGMGWDNDGNHPMGRIPKMITTNIYTNQ